MTDQALTDYIGEFIKFHRIDQSRTQEEIAAAADISRSTLSLLERGESVNTSTLIRVLRVLNKLEVMTAFEVNNSPSPLELAKREQGRRKRVRKPDDAPDSITDWS